MNLKFCANLSFMFQETQCLLERYHLAKQAGFRGVECASPYEYSIDKIIQAKTDADVEQILINVPTGDVVKGQLGYAALFGKEKEFLESLNLAIKYAKQLKCNKIHIMSGIVANPTDENHTLYEKNLIKATEILQKEGIIGLIEPINNITVPNYYMNSYERAINLISKISSTNLRLQLDIFHLQHLKGNLTYNIKNLLPLVGHIQIAQVPHRNEPDTPGEIDYKYIFSLLDKMDYNGWIGLEYKPLRQTEDGLKWMNELQSVARM